ncbi:MAG: hypothetical protein A3H50_00330 [Candidatus Levybacteria bacterium RIFCSPLOWO2_02_FULL_37_10]|nr:MAG: hypothetical protein A2860_03750 [Candidatus Levybacteria bacterium RIFCSPHIGHO2_01_FULL_37_33]OGH17546.1 MAG: hypothetical protein A3C97_01910 [Candidatus Levybacteria bacterium RIFCSPHIGHO2_02_FULL_37_11]OGH30064.1 MAG: hypothetical protein A3F30_03630 [Candidatus Levybacteria bacterium RIFCSPHIGHO2_12_FULL_37_12]OGH32358.1 MAG: hypothetical protein A2953_01790 [Candidatus Levybacteria bacterium RIFCSPLOWO2_01_FULL_36_54]OGH46320.1 MAG: hypothetical protein A3H50_00330 [Candidatus Lev
MNKYLGLLLFAIALLSSGFIYQTYYRPSGVGGIKSTGKVAIINMRVIKNHWKWDPSIIKIAAGTKIVLSIYNEDTYDHGFAIDVFGINRRLFPQTTTTINFTPSLSGKFNFYCSVPCGDGHYDQIGTLIVGEEKDTSALVPNKNFACNATNKLVKDGGEIIANRN